jgi:hypothetical protein
LQIACDCGFFATLNYFLQMPPSPVENVDNAPHAWTPLSKSAYTPHQRLDGESQFGVLAEPKRPSLRILPSETDEQNSTPRESLLAVMTANREQFNQRP